MGYRFTAECDDCQHRFTVAEGGGLVFHLLHCEQCGEAKGLNFDRFPEVRSRYRKSLNETQRLLMWPHDRKLLHDWAGEPITHAEYERQVEALAGKCECGGLFSFAAQARCPACNSTNYTDTKESGLCYD